MHARARISGFHKTPQGLTSFHGTPEGPTGSHRTHGETCKGKPHADIDWLKSGAAKDGGDHTCEQYQLMCLDQGALVVHDPAYNMLNGSPLPKFEISDLGVRAWWLQKLPVARQSSGSVIFNFRMKPPV